MRRVLASHRRLQRLRLHLAGTDLGNSAIVLQLLSAVASLDDLRQLSLDMRP